MKRPARAAAKRRTTEGTLRPVKAKSATPITIDELKRIFGPVREASLALNALNRQQPVEAPRLTPQEVQSLATKSGLHPQAIEEIEIRQQTEIFRIAEQRRMDAIKQSASAKKVLGSQAAAFVNGARAVPAIGNTVTRELLDSPILIWPTTRLNLDQSTIAPYNSIVKFHYHDDSGNSDKQVGGSEQVSFFFQWQNRSRYPTAISVDGYLIFNGTTRTVVRGRWDLNKLMTTLAVYGELEVFGQWTSAPTLLSGDLVQAVGELEETNGMFYQHSIDVPTNVFRGFDLQPSPNPIPVPGNGTVLLPLTVWINYAIDSGSIDVDFSTDAFEVMTPGVLITNWNPVHTPPIKA